MSTESRFSLQLVPRADAAELAARIRQGGANPNQRIDNLQPATPLLQVVRKCMSKWVNTVGKDVHILRLWTPVAKGGWAPLESWLVKRKVVDR